ncbi:hypothetical protein CLV62_10473 [Dysgonomonas alginatilytica]|uniref:Uncharacterized protein n=1 Tax=Dysgonomonas alginatilytica TaxID=1605892 RepID=A0A2V3PT62_9BACT|nr:hypothetical protein [Dysgonomonas alginatilytica]PXV66813.1 hypothetical protein CLV62_10473 [Dysgonomonas alginatilytica]
MNNIKLGMIVTDIAHIGRYEVIEIYKNEVKLKLISGRHIGVKPVNDLEVLPMSLFLGGFIEINDNRLNDVTDNISDINTRATNIKIEHRINYMKTFNSIMWILGTIYHLWTAIIAFSHSVIAGIVTLFLPALSEIYWFFATLGDNAIYTALAIIFTIGAIVYKLMGGKQ